MTKIDRAMLEHSHAMTGYTEPMSRLAYLSDFIFDFTTYDSEMGELFASKASESLRCYRRRKRPGRAGAMKAMFRSDPAHPKERAHDNLRRAMPDGRGL